MSQLNQTAIDKLFEIQTNNPARVASLPFAQDPIEVDFHSRSIGSRPILSTMMDHKSENVYFIMDRYWDFMDLSTTTCVITYKTYPADPKKSGTTGIYAVPYYDLYSAKAEPGSLEKDRMIIPWCIDGRVTQYEGQVEYAIRFYRIDESGKNLIYNLSTVPTTSAILYGLNVQPGGLDDANDLAGDFDLSGSMYEHFTQEINEIRRQDVFWIEYN